MSQYAGIDIGKEHSFSCVLDVKQKTFTYPADRMSLYKTETWLEGFKELAGACIDGPHSRRLFTTILKLYQDVRTSLTQVRRVRCENFT